MDYKEYLDKARLKQLAELQERYNQVYAKERAEAASSLIAGHRQLRRGLQNVGLAGRKGNLISGREKTAALEARRRYREYNAGLSRAANTFTTAAGQRMARQAIDDENRVKRAEAYAKWGDEYAAAKAEAEQEYAAKLEEAKQEHLQYAQEYQNSYNAFLAQQAQYQAWLQQQAAAQAAQQELIDPRFQGNNMQQAKQDLMAARAEQQRLQMQQMAQNGVDPRQNAAFNTQQGKVNYVSALAAARQQAVENELRNNDIDPRFAQNSVMQQTKPQASAIAASRRDETVRAQYEQNLNEWREKIQRAEGITKPKTRNEYDKWHEAQVARQQMIDYERRVAALKYPAISNLITLSDSEFAMRYDAAEKAYKHALQDAKILRKDSSSSMDDLSSDANAIEGKATEEFVKWQQAEQARNDAMSRYYADSVQTDMTLAPQAPAWASVTNHNGANIQHAVDHKWDATDYAKNHNTFGSKYTALINEWSLINGRTALNYTQTHALAGFGRHILSGGKEGQQYDAFVANCGAVFYNAPEGLKKVEREQMESLLTLANLMTDEERARFNTILKTNGSKDADKYFEFLYNSVLPQRFDEYTANENAFQARDSIGRIGGSIVSVPVNLAQSIPGVIHTLSTAQNDPVAAKLAAAKYNLAQNQRDQIGQQYSNIVTANTANLGKGFSEWAGNAANFLYGTVMSMADSATVAMISGGIGEVLEGAGVAAEMATKIGSAIGGTLLGGSAFNSAYQEALQNGLTPDKARVTAVGNGLNEMLFETLSIGTLLEKTGKSVLKPSKNAWVNLFVNSAVQAGVEGSEEVFTDIANKIWDNRINGIFSEEMQKIREYVASGMSFNEAKEKVRREFAEQLGMSFLGGAISGGFMGGGAQFLGMVQNRQNEKLGKGLRQDSKIMNAINDHQFENEYAQEILKQEKLTNQDVYELYAIMQQELAAKYKADVDQAVKDGKITQEEADLVRKWEENGKQIEKDGKVIGNENGVTAEEFAKVLEILPQMPTANKLKLLSNDQQARLVQAVGGETASIITQSETADREAEQTYRQTVREINNDTTLSPELKQKRLEAAARTRQNARSEASKIADTALTNKKGIGAKLETDGNGTVKVGKRSGKVTYDFSTKDNPGHQTVDSMTATEQSALRIAKIVAASRPDVNVKVEAEFVGEHANENGYYDPNTKTIHINMSGDNSVLWTLSHELTHHLANTDTEAYAALRTAIETALKDSSLTTTQLEERGFEYDLDKVDPYIAREGNLWDALVAFEREEHGYGKDAEEEVVARCCESFLGFNQFVKDFAHKQYKSAKAINKFIAQMNIDMQRVSEEARQSAAQRNLWNDESPENQILRQLTEIDKIANLWRIAVNAEAKKRQESKRTARENTVEQTNGNRYSKVDSVLAKHLDSEEMVKVYRAMQVIDGKLYPPMAAKVAEEAGGKRQLVEPTNINEWYVSEERPDLIDPKTGKWKLDKANGKTIEAAYNPYFHTSLSVLNDQFSSAYDRPNLVVVEGYVPKSELTSGYKAQYAKDAVGAVKWHSGTVSSKLKNPRTVILSRYFKAMRVLSDAEVAQKIKTMLKNENPNISIPQQLVTPGLYKALNEAGVKTTPMDTIASTKDSVQMENRINKLREEIASIENDSERLFTNGREFDNARLKKLKNELNALIEQERKASVKTSLSDILANLDLYRRSDLISMAGQLTQAWDDVDEMTTQELRDGIREIIEEREYTPLELQAKSRGLWVRPATIASTKDSVKLSDTEYIDLARRYESGDESVEAELRKQVDAAAKAAGYTVKAYHGTNRIFYSFRGANEMGYHFGTKAAAHGRVGRGKSARIIPAYLRANNPVIFDYDMGSWDANFRLANDLHEKDVISAEELNEIKYGRDGERRFIRSDVSANRILQGILKAKGYDSIKYKNTMETKSSWSYIVFDAEQAKSADLVTYDSDGNIIPLSERFKTDRTGEDAWKNEDIRYSKADKVKLSSVDSPVVNRIADESFPIQPKTNRAEAEYEKTVAHDTKVRLADIQDSMFHPVMRSIKDAVPISERTLAKARSLKDIPYNISMYESTEKAIVELAKFIKENYSGKYDVQGNLLLPEETVQSNNIFSNASYLKDAEPTTECYRQTIYRAFLKVVTDQLGRPVTEREAIIVNQACIEIGLDAPCIYCYSLLDRKAKEGYKLQYLAERDAFLAKIDEEYHGDIEAFKRDRAKNFDRYNELYLSRVTDPAAYKDGVYDKSMARKGNAAKVDRVKLWLDVYESGYHDGTMITANDVRNIEAEEASLKEAKGDSLRTRELKDILYWSQSASQAKKIIPYSAYTNDGRRSILSWSQNTIDALNREYGLRWYSHADFHPAFIVDNMQQIMDASVKGLKGLMYVKPVEAAKIFAPTGMLINVSCFAQYKNGQYVADDRMGADWTEVQKLRKQYENVGAVMVVTTDDMWMWAMTQDWVDVIIPLHLVRSGSEFVDTFGLHNYSEEQADKLVGKAAKEKYEAFIADLAAQQEKTLSDKEVNALKKANKSIYPGEHENDYAKYMEACEKRGLTPRFDRMRQLIEEGGMSWGGKEITLQDYMKCVSETRMPYTKAQTLKPSFDFDAAKQTAATLPEKGFFNYFKQSSEWNGKTMTMQDWVDQAVADINAKKDPSKLGYGRDLAVDENGKYLEIGTRAEAKRRGVGGIHDTRSSKMDKVRLSTADGTRTFTYGDVTAKMYGHDVTLDGGKVRQRVQMLETLAERYDHVTVDASSEAEARAFENAGAKRVADEFSTGNEYGTYEFKFVESQFKRDSQFDAKQKANFAKAVLKQVGNRRNFTDQQMVKYRAALERAMTYLWNSTYGKGDQMAAYDAVDRLFDRILNSYSLMTEADADMRDALMSQMRKLKTANGRTYYQLDVTETQMSEIRNAHDNVKTYTNLLSKALGARVVVKQVDGATMLENTFKNATDSRIKNDTVEGNMPGELLRLAQETMEKRTNPYKGESDDRAAKKEAMWDAALNIIGGEKSTQQKIREAVKEARAAERKAAKEKTVKAVDEARLAERMHEGRSSAKRERRIKEQFVETTQKRKEQQIKSDIIKILQNGTNKIASMLAHPTESSHIPVQLARTVVEYANVINDLLKYRTPKTGENAGQVVGTKRGEFNLDRILDAYKMSFENDEVIAQAKAENPNYDPRGALLDKADYDEHLVKMLEWVNKVARGKSVNDFDAYELRVLMDSMRGVIHTITDANKLIGTSERKAIWQVGDKMVKELESAPKIKGGFARFFLEESLDLRRIAKVFSGSNENAEFVKLSDMLNRGAIEKERVAQVLSGMFDPLTKDYGDEIRKWYGKNAEWIDTGITKNGRKVEITKGMRVSLAMHVLNAGNMRHIENGGVTIPNRELYAKGKLADAYANGTLVRLNADQINTIISQMTEAEKAYVEVAKEFFHQRTGYYVNKTSLQLLGYRKATVENYFPIHTDRNYTKTDFASVVRDGSIEGQGFLKERVMASNPVYLEDITSVVNRQIKGVSLYAGLAVPMRNFNAVMNASVYEDENGNWVPRTTVRKAMTQSMGEYGAKVVQGFLQDVSGMSAVDVTPGEQLVAKLQTRYVKAVLLANLKVTLKQAASYPTAAAVIPWKYLNKALLKGGRNQRLISRADVDLINQYTPLYQMRREGMANEITSIMAERGLEQKMPWLLGWITKMDVATVGRLWSACEYMVADQQNLPVGSDAYYKAVAEVFNQTIQQTQPNFTPLQRNAALRSKNPVVRTLTLFGTQRMQNGGILIESAMELAHSKNMSKEAQAAAKAKFGRAVVSQLVQNVMLVAIGLVVDALRGRMKEWQDDDKDITLESVAKVMGDQFLGNIFGSFLGGSEVWDIVSTAFKRATNANTYDTEFTVPSLDAIETIIGFFNKDSVSFVQYMSGDHTADEKITRLKNFSFKLAKAAGYLTGFPFENIAKTIVKGWIPALQDIYDATQTGELIPWLHQSGKLDSKKIAANYKAWTKAGYSGRDFFYWEKQLNGVSGGRDGRIPILLDSDLTNEQKALMMQMFDTADGYADGTVFYNKKGEAIIDFTAPSEKQQALPKPNAEPSEAPNAEPTAEPTPKPTENPLTEARQEGVQAAVKLGVPEQTAFDAFLAYQNMGKNKDESDGYSRNDEFREWLFKNVDDPHQKAVLEYQVIGQASSVKGAITYRDSGVVYRDYTNESWFKLSEHNLAKDGTNKRYEAGKQLEKTGLKVDKTVTIYDGLKELTKKAEWIDYLKNQNLNDDQIRIFLWSRGWKY